MLAYIKLSKLFREHISRKVTDIVIAHIKGSFWVYAVILLVIMDVGTMISVKVNSVVGSLVTFVPTLILFLYIGTRQAGIGLYEDKLVIMKLKPFISSYSRIYEIPMDKIRSITVSKRLLSVSLKISFISDVGKLEKHKYGFNTFVIGSAEQQDNAKNLYNKLLGIQKVIDKGDF